MWWSVQLGILLQYGEWSLHIWNFNTYLIMSNTSIGLYLTHWWTDSSWGISGFACCQRGNKFHLPIWHKLPQHQMSSSHICYQVDPRMSLESICTCFQLGRDFGKSRQWYLHLTRKLSFSWKWSWRLSRLLELAIAFFTHQVALVVLIWTIMRS